MGITQYEIIDKFALWKALDAQIDDIKACSVAFRMKPKETASDFSKAVNKLMLIFEEICKRRVD